MAITVWLNWKGSGTIPYTLDSTEYFNGDTTLAEASGTLTENASSPWNGRYTLDISSTAGDGVYDDSFTSGAIPATSGRILMLLDQGTTTNVGRPFDFRAADAGNGFFRMTPASGWGTASVELYWDGYGSSADLTVTLATLPCWVELRYDVSDSTAGNWLQGRSWTLGGSPGSLSGGATTGGSAGTTDAFTIFRYGDTNTADDEDMKLGHLMIDDDPDTDLSAYTAYIDYPPGGGGDPEGRLIGGKLIRGGLLRSGVL